MKVLFGIGACLLLLGAVLGGCWLFIHSAVLRSRLVLTDSSSNFDIWENISRPIYMSVTMFNVTNAEAVEKNSTVLPQVVEMGPYVWQEHHARENFTWNDDNDTVTYRESRYWVFDPSRSNGSLSDLVTNFNVIATTVAYAARDMPLLLRLFVNRFIERTQSTVFVTRSVRELMFEGYVDPLLQELANSNTTLFPLPFSRFGYFINRNNSYDGWFNMHTGDDDKYAVGLLTRWNFAQYTGAYDRPCDEVKGSSGDVWPPLKDYADVHYFSTDFCAALPLSYEGSSERSSIDGLRFVATSKAFDNGVAYPERACLCTDVCVPVGAVNVSACKWGAPLFLSLPHFLHADPYYLTLSHGLEPEDEQHRFEIGLNPMTGVLLYQNARTQLNLMIENFPSISLFEGFAQRRFAPLLWIDVQSEIDGRLESIADMLLTMPMAGQGAFFGVAALGVLLILISLFLSLRRSWDDPEAKPLVPDAAATARS